MKFIFLLLSENNKLKKQYDECNNLKNEQINQVKELQELLQTKTKYLLLFMKKAFFNFSFKDFLSQITKFTKGISML